ncbi:excalibur calcium-binding domain-containing protein, partial [Leucobacter sp. M11]|uniref:excalibur calcium-binding domain-containing protein n=1 Tax=Leucobacter sp. M11 TaxID=2993565 RepID=UPI002D7F698E
RAVTGEWAPGTTFAYRWERLTEQGTATVAAAPEYALQAGDGGASLRVIVTGVQGDSAAVTRASEWLDVARFALAPATPIITGTPRVGQPLKATAGTWAPAGTATSAQWLRNGVAIPGATTLSYTPSAADATAKLTVRVTGSLPGYRSEHRDAAPVTITGLLTTATPGISGNLWAGQKVTATAGAWTAGTALSYQWLRNGTAIKGATGSSYVLVAADSATRLTVRVTGTKSGYVTASAISAQKTVLRTLAGATPKLSGTARSGQTLKAAVGTWTAGTTLKTQWLRNGAPIAGATGASYRLTNADSGTRVSVRVTGSRSGYATATKQSAARAVEARFASAPKPKVSGKPVIGATLTAQAGSWKPAPALKTQWLRNGAAISGATRGSYTLTAADVGKQLSVRVTATKAGYTAVTVQSASTGKVAKATTYQNCSALNRVYPNGVGKLGAKDRVAGGGKPVTSFFVSAQLYQANAKSDRDKDGIACEQR